MITKVYCDREKEFFLFHNGKLIYKKWLEQGVSALFDKYGFVHRSYNVDKRKKLK